MTKCLIVTGPENSGKTTTMGMILIVNITVIFVCVWKLIATSHINQDIRLNL